MPRRRKPPKPPRKKEIPTDAPRVETLRTSVPRLVPDLNIENIASEKDGICNRCWTIHAVGMQGLRLTTDENTVFGHYLASLDHIHANATCHMCRFFHQMRWDDSIDGNYQLHIFSAQAIYHKPPSATVLEYLRKNGGRIPWGTTLFGVVPDRITQILASDAFLMSQKVGFIADSKQWAETSRRRSVKFEATSYSPAHPSTVYPVYQGERVPPLLLDYETLRGWLSCCGPECTRTTALPQDMLMYLIDCKTRMVTKCAIRRIKYVALSYMWGSTQKPPWSLCEGQVARIPDTCPVVVEDAIKVTLEMGYQYIWIDMFCILDDPSLKHDQIGRMDVIYKCAAFTIIATAGHNADHGLPGVSRARTVPQPQLNVGRQHHTYVSTLPEPSEAVQQSKYSTRAWTYQEWFYSSHRMIFTDSQVSFQCPKETHCESMASRAPPWFSNVSRHLEFRGYDLPNDQFLSRDTEIPELQAVYNIDGTSRLSYNSAEGKPPMLRLFEFHVSRYSSRELSYDCDALDAARSILDRFLNNSQSITHLCGIPFQPRSSGDYRYFFSYKETDGGAVFSLAYGLCWTHGTSATLPKRRSQSWFPSWSWTGWVGSVSWLPFSTVQGVYIPPAPEVTDFQHVVLVHRQEVRYSDVRKWRPQQFKGGYIRDLIITGQWVDLCFDSHPAPSSPSVAYYLRTPDLGSIASQCRLHLTWAGIPNFTNHTYKGINLGENANKSVTYLLVVMEVTNIEPGAGDGGGMVLPSRYDAGGEYGMCQRIGVIQVPTRWYAEQEMKVMATHLG